MVGATTRLFFLDLQNDPELIAAYRHWHRPGGPPAAVTQSIKRSGVVSMEIWQAGDRLVMLMETGPEYDADASAARDATNPDIQAWERLMDGYQRRLPFAAGGMKWVPAEKIYDLKEQSGE